LKKRGAKASDFTPRSRWAKRVAVNAIVAVAAVLLAVPLALNAIAYTARWQALRRVPSCDEGLPFAVAARAFLADCGALVWTWQACLRPRRQPSTPAKDQHPGIVLIPGLGLNAGALSILTARLRQAGWSPLVLPGVYWRPDIDTLARALGDFLRALPADQPVTALLGFGVGGLVARQYLRRHPARGIQRVVTLGTPHQGVLTGLTHLPGWNAVRPDAAVMRHLAAGDRVPQQFEVTAIYSDFDAFAAPTELAYYPGAFNIEVRGVGHFTLLRSRRIGDLVIENLNAPRGA
jgi:pimeloyl-ACP methyl ester carboxylesterase